LPNFIFGPSDLVVAVGKDGLVANTLKYLDGQTLYAVNDLFIGPISHGSARYTLHHETQRERHSSKGVIVSDWAGFNELVQQPFGGRT